MSDIDVYKYSKIGEIKCQFDVRRMRHDWIPINRLDEDVKFFNAKKGDIIVGEGCGGDPALLIKIPEFIIDTTTLSSEFDENPIIPYWDGHAYYEYSVGYSRIGWDGFCNLEYFVAEHVLSFILKTYPEIYEKFAGLETIDRDGSICRTPQNE